MLSRGTFFVWIFHAMTWICFFIIGRLYDVSLPSLVCLYSFVWAFFSLQHFHGEPANHGVTLYELVEMRGQYGRLYGAHLMRHWVWHLLLLGPWWIAQFWNSPSALETTASFLVFAFGLSSLIVMLGPAVGSDRSAGWFFVVFLVPLAFPLLLTFWQASSESGSLAPLKLLTGVSLSYALAGYYLFPLSLRLVDD